MDGDAGVGPEGGFPFGKAVAPVAVDAFDAGDAVFGNFFEQAVDDVGGGVVCVDKDGEFFVCQCGHGDSVVFMSVEVV